MSRSRVFVVACLSVAGLCMTGCDPEKPAAKPAPKPEPKADATMVMDAGTATSPTGNAMDGGGATNATDAAAAVDIVHVDAGPPAVLTVRIINPSDKPLKLRINPDVNEMVHVRRLSTARRLPDASAPAGEVVKFFPLNDMPACTDTSGAGYGGLGQPRIEEVPPGGSIDFPWDGKIRREVNLPDRGVCAKIEEPSSGKYRFEFDQPYEMPSCNWPVVTLPLSAESNRVVEIRCVRKPRTPRPAAEE